MAESSRLTWFVLLAAGLCGWLGGQVTPACAATLYAAVDTVNSPGLTLITIDTATGVGTVVGPFTGDALTTNGLATIGTRLYGWQQVGGGSPDSLIFSIHPQTAVTTAIGLVGWPVSVPEGCLDYNPADGMLYGGQEEFFRVDPATGAGTHLGATGPRYLDISGLAITDGGVAYALGLSSGLGGDGLVRLYTVDLSNASLTLVGLTGQSTTPAKPVGGLAYVDGTLYGAIGSDLYWFDTTTGAGTLIGPNGLGNVYGLTEAPAPVPEPATLLLVGGAIAMAAWGRRRR
jgi:hypothetical protein